MSSSHGSSSLPSLPPGRARQYLRSQNRHQHMQSQLHVRNNQRQLREQQEVKSAAKSLATADVSPYSREYEARMTALRSRGSMSARRAIHGHGANNGTPTRLQPLHNAPATDNGNNNNDTTNHNRHGSNGSNGSHHSNDEKVQPTVHASQSMRKLRESSSASYMAANGGNNVAIGVGMVMDSVHNAKAPTHGYAVNHPLASLHLASTPVSVRRMLQGSFLHDNGISSTAGSQTERVHHIRNGLPQLMSYGWNTNNGQPVLLEFSNHGATGPAAANAPPSAAAAKVSPRGAKIAPSPPRTPKTATGVSPSKSSSSGNGRRPKQAATSTPPSATAATPPAIATPASASTLPSSSLTLSPLPALSQNSPSSGYSPAHIINHPFLAAGAILPPSSPSLPSSPTPNALPSLDMSPSSSLSPSQNSSLIVPAPTTTLSSSNGRSSSSSLIAITSAAIITATPVTERAYHFTDGVEAEYLFRRGLSTPSHTRPATRTDTLVASPATSLIASDDTNNDGVIKLQLDVADGGGVQLSLSDYDGINVPILADMVIDVILQYQPCVIRLLCYDTTIHRSFAIDLPATIVASWLLDRPDWLLVLSQPKASTTVAREQLGRWLLHAVDVRAGDRDAAVLPVITFDRARLPRAIATATDDDVTAGSNNNSRDMDVVSV